jgi:hypothetical protein
MTRSLVKLGVALIDAGARREVARWRLGLLESAHRVYLATRIVEVDEGRRSILLSMATRSPCSCRGLGRHGGIVSTLTGPRTKVP